MTLINQPIIFSSIIESLGGHVYGAHLKIPEDICRLAKKEGDKRFLFTLDGKVEKRGAILSAKIFHYLLLNQQDLARISKSFGEEVQVEIRADRSKYGMPMPPELEELLLQDTEANIHFEKLSKGKQRSLIYLVAKVKNTQSRINKALAIAEHLKKEEGRLNYKALNALIKQYNQRDLT